jgi:hypothetical protein
MPMRHVASFTDDQWTILQELSGMRNPASYVREVVERHIRAHVTTSPVNAPPPMRVNQLLEGRWKAIGCGKQVFDHAFNSARDWYVEQFPSEEEALGELEERHEHQSLNNPRAWLYKNWFDAGRPGK